MKNFSILTATMTVFLLSCQPGENTSVTNQPQPAFDETAETAAIMKVIENETKCFFDGNYACWANKAPAPSHPSSALAST